MTASIRITAQAAPRTCGRAIRRSCRTPGERKFDAVVAESLDRLSRDQEHVAGLYKQLSFHGVVLVTIGEGEISELHVGLKGAMSALYLKDLAQKTRRGLEGRVRQGRSAGGLSYGYRIVRTIGPDGAPTTGEREVDAQRSRSRAQHLRRFRGRQEPEGDREGPEQPGRPRAARRSLGRVDHLRQLAARHRHPEQRALRRPARLEPPAIRQGPRDGSSTGAAQS